MDYREHITINPEIRFGKACVKNTRITVFEILVWLSKGMTNDDIINDFPELRSEDIHACLAYSADREHKLRHPSI